MDKKEEMVEELRESREKRVPEGKGEQEAEKNN